MRQADCGDDPAGWAIRSPARMNLPGQGRRSRNHLGVLQLVAVLASALVLGLTLSHVLQAPGSRRLEGPTWLEVQHTFYGGFAVVGGLSEVVGLLAATTLAVLLRHRARAALPHALGAVGLLGTLLTYWVGNRPVNALVARWTPGTLPADWSSYRDTWETAHAVSCGLAAFATVVLLVAAVWGRPAVHTVARRA